MGKKTVKAWVATDPWKFDVENMSFYKTEEAARQAWGNEHTHPQQFLPITIIYEFPKRKSAKEGREERYEERH